MQALVLRCRSGVRYHFGETALDDTSQLLHADTLFSALTHGYALAHDAAKEWIGHVQEGRIRISSGLHCAELSWNPRGPIFFVPRPPLRYTGTPDDPSSMKRLRRIRYVSLGVLAEIRAHLRPATPPDRVPSCELDLLDPATFPRLAGGYACTVAELAPVGPEEIPRDRRLYPTYALPRVEVRTRKTKDTFYHAAGVSPVPVEIDPGRSIHGHFYVLVEHSLEEAAWRRFLGCVRLLADEGVGGERTVGYGWFEDVQEVEVAVPETEGADTLRLSLAPVIPADGEEFARALHYELFLRGGGSLGEHGDPEAHRRRVRMLKEGALLEGPVRGRIVDVSPERRASQDPPPHPILRSGINFSLPLGAGA